MNGRFLLKSRYYLYLPRWVIGVYSWCNRSVSQGQQSVLSCRSWGAWRPAGSGREHANNMIPETGLRIIGDVGQRLQCGTVTVQVFPARSGRSRGGWRMTGLYGYGNLSISVFMQSCRLCKVLVMMGTQGLAGRGSTAINSAAN